MFHGRSLETRSSRDRKSTEVGIVDDWEKLPEVKIRMRGMKGLLKGIRTKILGNRKITLKRRLNVVRCYLYSKCFFQAGTWKKLRLSEAREVNGSVMSIYRAMFVWVEQTQKGAN